MDSCHMSFPISSSLVSFLYRLKGLPNLTGTLQLIALEGSN